MTPRWRALAWAGALAVTLALIVLRGHVRTDLSLFLPDAANPVQHLVVDQLRHGPAARVVLAAIGGAPGPALARLSRGLAGALRGDPAFEGIYNGAGGTPLAGLDTLRRYRYLLSPQMDRPDPLGIGRLRRAFDAIHRRLTGVVPGMDVAHTRSDPTGAFSALLEHLRPGGPERRQGVWFTEDGRALLVLRTSAAPLDLNAQGRAVHRLRAAFDGLPGADRAALTLTGQPVIALRSRSLIKSEVQRVSLLATVFALGLLVAVTRSWRFLVLGALPLAAALTAGVSAVMALFGGIHGITVAFGATLVGVALDYPVHLFLHRRRGESGMVAMRRIRRPLWLGAATTALGFAALCFAGFAGIAQLGVFAIAGVLAAVGTTHWLLPGWVGDVVAKPPPVPALQGRWPRVAAAALLLASAAYLIARPPRWEGDLEHMSPVPEAMKRLDHRLRSAAGLAGPRDLIVVGGADPQQALRRTEAVVAALRDSSPVPAVAQPLTDWLASQQRQLARRGRLPGAAELRHRVGAALGGLPLKAAAFSPFVEDVAASRRLAPLGPDALSGSLDALAGQKLIRDQDQWWSLVPLAEVTDRRALARLVSGHTGAHYLDLKRETNQLVNGYRRQATIHFAVGGGVILLSLLLALGWRRRTLHVAAVAFGGVLLAVAALALAGVPLSLFSLVSLLLVVGLGLDYGLFTSEPDGTGLSLASATVCAASTVLAFAVLATADIAVLGDIGSTVAAGAAASWLLAWLMARPTDINGETRS